MPHSPRHACQAIPDAPSGKATYGFDPKQFEQSVTSRFEQIVMLHGERPAVKMGDMEISYRNLNAIANRLAHALCRDQPGKGDRVAMLVGDAVMNLAAILGIFKTGQICVPLDPRHPDAHLDFVLDDADVSTIVVDSAQRERTRALCGSGRRLLDIDRLASELPDVNPRHPVDPDDYALIQYTSGSTGKPKGVIGSHRMWMRSALGHMSAYTLVETDRIALLTSVSGGHGMITALMTLLAGAAICPYDIASEGMSGLADWMDQEEITVYVSPPSVYRSFVRTLTGPQKLHRVRLIRLGAEAVHSEDLDLFRPMWPERCEIVNAYSSNECGHVALYFIGKDTELRGEGVPIGYAVPGMEVVLWNDGGQPVPAGQIGEIVVRSRYLSPGYWRRPDLTAQVFLSDPHQSDVRVLRTGDLGRFREDGCLEHHGRKDFRAKIRGFLVEPGEVEAALGRHPGLRDVAVAAREMGSSEKRLVAYVVLAPDQVLTDGALRDFLKDKLPEYMVPSVFMVMDRLPLTPNGKVDYQALPEPGRQRPTLDGEYLPPRTAVEQKMAFLWAEMLNIDTVGIHDNFFDLGGHSLTAAQLVAAIRDRFDVDLPLRALFESPTVAGLLLEMERRQGDLPAQPAGMFSLPPLVRAPLDCYEPFPLTDIQQAYWVGRSSDFELGNVPTRGYREFECFGLDLERLEAAWRKLIERHDMLRAVMTADGQQQVLEQVPPYTIKVLDLRGQTTDRIEVELAAIREQMSYREGSADHWPLFEIRVAQLTDGCMHLYFSADVLIVDLWSRVILFREWRQLYDDLGCDLPPLEVSYRDYVVAALKFRDSEFYRRSQQYWRERLLTLPPAPQLPLAQSPTALSRPKFVCWSAHLDSLTWARLKRHAGRLGLTSSSVLLSAYAELLKVWSKSPQFTINLTHFHRMPLHPKINDVVGDFTSLILLEVGGATETETLKDRAVRLQQQLCDDLDHAYFSGVEVMRQLARREGGKPRASMPVVFTSALAHTGDGKRTGASSKWLGHQIHFLSPTPQVWLDHVVREEDGELVLNWNFVENLFPDDMMRQMFASYQHLLASLANDPTTWEETWPYTVKRILSGLQEHQPNTPQTGVPEGLIHTMVLQRAAEQPHRAAVVWRDQMATYGQVQRATQRLGFELRNRGARPNTLVAVVMEKGWEQVVAVLGILTAGAAYLPLDPRLPTDRLSHILRQGRVELVVTQPHLENAIDWPDNVRRVGIDEELFAEGIVDPLEPVQQPTDLAYVIYTSGSTGEPKGVMIDHRGALNTVMAINERFGVGFEDRVLALSSLSFDLSVYDIFGTLIAGGTIVMPESDGQRDPSHWAGLILKYNVSVWNSVPALMSLLIEYVTPRPGTSLQGLRLVLLSGDWIPVGLPSQIRARATDAQVISLGGATEASIWSILYPIAQVNPAWKSIPYGRALPNQEVYVLNEALEPCPCWVPGQLHIAGVGLAKGYWRNEKRTHENFFVHPRTGQPLYRTGDFGRYLRDGNIEFLGREDNQVKIHGSRVELGEIEAALHDHPHLQAAVVIAHTGAQSDRRLLAYVIPKQGQKVAASDLQEFLLRKLPDYMVPSAFVTLERLPLTSNGKVDRSALPSPDAEVTGARNRAPDTEDALIPRIGALVESVMKLNGLVADANLLFHGATSIDIIRIINRIDDEFDFRLKVDQVYEDPTIKGLARRCRQHMLRGEFEVDDVQQPEESILNGTVLRDPMERKAFQRSQPGLRGDLSASPSIALRVLESQIPSAASMERRRTHRHYSTDLISLDQLSQLLGVLRQASVDTRPRYIYPSAGGLYPIQTYLWAKPNRIVGVPSGLYYHQPVEHRLVVVSRQVEVTRDLYGFLINAPIFDDAAFAIFFIGQLDAIRPMYGSMARDYCLIEAGSMLQSLMIAAPACQIGICPVGNLNFERIRAGFLLTSSHELLHSLLAGRVDKEDHKIPVAFPEAHFHNSVPRDDREEFEL